jgi:outer membrane protein TolC
MKRLHLVAALVLAVSPPLFGAAAETPVSLAEALRLAAEGNPEILAQGARTDAEAARAGVASRARWPRLSVVTGWSRTDTPSMVFAEKLNAGEFAAADFAIDRLNAPDALSHLATTVAAELPLDVFGRTRARARAQSSGARVAEAATEESLQELRLRVVEAYRRAAVARRMVEVTESTLASARAREAYVEARVAEGAVLRADLLRVRARRRQREADLADRRADEETAVAVFSRALGGPPGVSYHPTEWPSAPPPLEDDAAAWTSRALAGRPSVRAAAERVVSQTWSLRAEERAAWPELAAWGQVQDDRSRISGGNRSGAFGLSLRWNAFDASRGQRVAAAAAEARAAELDQRAAADQARLEVQTAWHRAQAARARHAAAAGGAEEGREALRVVQERREQGLATLTDELETEAASLAAELEELRSAADVAVADAAVRRAAGGL